MPAKDDYHDVMIRALVKDGWSIVREQYPIRVGLKRVWIDLSAEKDSDGSAAFIEVKDFHQPSSVEGLRDTLGQYILYRAAMKYAKLSDIPLYLAVPQLAFIELLNTPLGKLAIREAAMNLVIFSPVEEVIEQWLPYTKLSEL